jgi:orotidine-5'-phosphate decarboxylase
MSTDRNKHPLIIALDVPTEAEARGLVQALGDSVFTYKVGLELYAGAGMHVVRWLVDQGKDVFLDLKLYDIGETVKRATAQVARCGARFLTVHGSHDIMAAAVEGRGATGLHLLAVTVLTSLDERDLLEMGYPASVEELVALRVRNALRSGVDGIVCSPLEVAGVRALAGPEAILITPGVRSAGSGKGDQKRTATPREAFENGADYLVIGRQVTRAEKPDKEVEKILRELDL